MFLQHMLAVLRTNGMMATVMPHGVLFRGGVEKEVRKGIIKDDLLTRGLDNAAWTKTANSATQRPTPSSSRIPCWGGFRKSGKLDRLEKRH